MPVSVFFTSQSDPFFHERLDALIGADVHMHLGPDLPDPADFEILVGGRPERRHLEASPNLKTMLIPYAGLPPRTRELMEDFPHIAVHNLHHNAAPTAELAMALLLAAAKRVVPLDRSLRNHDWTPRYEEGGSGLLLSGRRALVLGYGHVGQRVARACRGLGMEVMATRRTAEGTTRVDDGVELHPPSSLHELLPRAAFLFLCLPGTPQTEGLIGAEELALMPRHSVLVNVGRGDVVEEDALYDALEAGIVGAAGLDAWYYYPESVESRTRTRPSSRPFWELDNVVLSPHRAGHSDHTEELRASHLAELLHAAVRGEHLPNRVSIALGY